VLCRTGFRPFAPSPRCGAGAIRRGRSLWAAADRGVKHVPGPDGGNRYAGCYNLLHVIKGGSAALRRRADRPARVGRAALGGAGPSAAPSPRSRSNHRRCPAATLLTDPPYAILLSERQSPASTPRVKRPHGGLVSRRPVAFRSPVPATQPAGVIWTLSRSCQGRCAALRLPSAVLDPNAAVPDEAAVRPGGNEWMRSSGGFHVVSPGEAVRAQKACRCRASASRSLRA
jgi:hypothetical protein